MEVLQTAVALNHPGGCWDRTDRGGNQSVLQSSTVGLTLPAHLAIITSVTISCCLTVMIRPLRPQAGLEGTALSGLSWESQFRNSQPLHFSMFKLLSKQFAGKMEISTLHQMLRVIPSSHWQQGLQSLRPPLLVPSTYCPGW